MEHPAKIFHIFFAEASQGSFSPRKTDISMFINDLPNGKDTRVFSTEDASGSTSQAANVVEAIEAGASLLLMDEDTSATNFMIRGKTQIQERTVILWARFQKGRFFHISCSR